MGLRSATIWIVLAGLLGVTLVWVRSTTGNAQAVETFSMRMDSASIIGLRLEKPDGSSQAVSRDPDGLWSLRVTGSEGGLTAWPADDSRVRGGIRLLASSVFDTRDDAAALADTLGSLFVTLRGGVETEIVFESRGIGGRVPVRVRSGDGVRAGWASRSLLDTYLGGGIDSGLAAWRERTVLVTAAQSDRLTIEVLDDRVTLKKLNGRWVLQEPIMIEADSAVVEAAITALSSLEIGRFLTSADPSDAAYGLSDPVGVLEIGWPARGATGSERTARVVLGSLAEASGEVLHAHVSVTSGDRVFGPSLVTLGVPELPGTTDSYVRRRASSINATDVRGISVRRRSEATPAAALSRTIDGWTLDDGPDRDGIGRVLVGLVCGSPAASFELVDSAGLEDLPGYLGEIGLIIGGGVEAEVFAVALPTPGTPTLRLIGKDLGQGTRGMWGFGGADADEIVRLCIGWFGL